MNALLLLTYRADGFYTEIIESKDKAQSSKLVSLAAGDAYFVAKETKTRLDRLLYLKRMSFLLDFHNVLIQCVGQEAYNTPYKIKKLKKSNMTTLVEKPFQQPFEEVS